jgi:hypothetical protein
VKFGNSATKILEMLREAFEEHSLSRTAVFWMAFAFQSRSNVSWRWRMFRVTKHQLNDRKCSKIRELIHEDHRRTIHELADTVGISYGVRQEIFTENLDMCHTAAKCVPRLLPNDQK